MVIRVGMSFWEGIGSDATAKPRRGRKPKRGRMQPSPHYKPDRPFVPTPRVSVRADLLDRAADLIADRDPSLSELFKRMALRPDKDK